MILLAGSQWGPVGGQPVMVTCVGAIHPASCWEAARHRLANVKEELMNPDIKRKWLRALRSGKYVQGQGQLYDGERHCCLGVLCEVVDVVESDVWRQRMTIPSPVREIVDFDAESVLVEANDRHKWTFEEIADWIEVFL